MDIFDSKTIKPMQINEAKTPFNSQDWIYELKLDGVRCLAYLNSSRTDLRSKIAQPLLPRFPELDNLHFQSNEKCILDGELIVIKNGVPDFFELQRRLIQSPYSQQSRLTPFQPASFVAYDILYYKDHLVTDLPLMERKQILEQLLYETVDLAISRYTEECGKELFQLALKEKLEGVVAKRKDSHYTMNEPTNAWVKFQKNPTKKYVICGILWAPNNKKRFLLGQYQNNAFIYKGSVDITTWDNKQISLVDYVSHLCKKIPESPFSLTPTWSQEYEPTWFEPQIVCSVEQPSVGLSKHKKALFRGICEDTPPKECINSPS